MLNMLPSWGRIMVDIISNEIVENEDVPPEAIIASMFTHASQDITLNSRPKSLAEYSASAIIAKLMRKFEIKAIGSSIVKDVPIRGTNVYEHKYETKDGVEFYAYQFGFGPISGIDQLSSSILELNTTKGCIMCQFTGYVDDDIECPVCRNGATRGVVVNDPKYKIFKNYGWDIFRKEIGDKNADTLIAFAKEYHSFFTNMEFYCNNAKGLITEYKEEHGLGFYFDKEVEHDLFLIMAEDEDEEGDEDDEDEESFD